MTADSRDARDDRRLLAWILPALFALLVSVTIRAHSLTLSASMPRVVGCLLALAVGGLVVLRVLGHRLAVPRDLALPLLALAASAVISTATSGNPQASLLRLALYLAMALLAVVVYLCHRDSRTLPLEACLLGIGIVHLPFLATAVWWINELAPPFWSEFGPRLADFAHVRQYGEFAFFAAVSATGAGVLSKRLAWPAFLLGTAAVFGIVLSGCRGALLSWIAFVLLCSFFSAARRRAALLGACGLATASALVWYLDDSGLLRSPNIFSRVTEFAQGDGNFGSGRIQLWLDSIRQIAVHPLFGSGPEGYWISQCCDRNIMQAHNFVLQFLLEFGVVGCGLLVLLLYRAVRHAGGPGGLHRRLVAQPGNRVLACLVSAYLCYGLIDQMLYHLVPLLLFALYAGLLAAGLARASGPPAARA